MATVQRYRRPKRKDTAKIRMSMLCNIGGTDWAYRLEALCRRYSLVNQSSGPALGEALRLVVIVGMCRKYGISDTTKIASYAVAQARPIMLASMAHRTSKAFSPRAETREVVVCAGGQTMWKKGKVRVVLGDWVRDQFERIARTDARCWDQEGRVLDNRMLFELASAGFSEPTVVEQVARLYAPEANRLRAGLNRIEAFVQQEVSRLIAQPAGRAAREAGAA